MKLMQRLGMAAGLSLLLAINSAGAAELVLPQNRTAFYSDEAIELAVTGLAAGATAAVELVPDSKSATPVAFQLRGDAATIAHVLPPRALAPGTYAIRVDGKESGKLTVAAGVNNSTMLLSQTVGWNEIKAGGANFLLGNAFSFGLVGPDGLPLREIRGRRSPGLDQFDRAMAMDLPTINYMYWTGYVTHKPFGTEKSWAEKSMVEVMRLLNFHTAQRLRRYKKNIISNGTLDEPGLSWGRTAAGGMASGFPNWDEQPWYESRGWKFTDDPGSRPDDDWMKYLTIRCAILKENNAWARDDFRAVWPDAVFSTDLYAPQANMDGTDPMNQEVNDIPSTHVFMDWGLGKVGVIGALYLEKAHDPVAKIAHAMNGQLFGAVAPQPQQRDSYRLMLNGMLASGLASNWWLNTGGMTKEDLMMVNEPGLRIGPIFKEMAPSTHEVAVLWSFTEISMRQKEMAAKEAKKKTGEQIKLMIASMPENTAIKEGMELNINAYNIGGNYKEQILSVHQALSRAGYPAHIVHERILPRGVLKNYKTLVLVGQTFELPADIKKALAAFTGAGGRIVVDSTTTVPFANDIRTAANFKDPAYRWTPLFLQDAKTFKTPKEASYFQTNYFMDEQVRQAVVPMKESMKQTASKPVFVSDSVFLAGERHVGGEGSLLMVINAFEQLPEVPDDKKYIPYNYAPYQANFTLVRFA